MTKGAFVLKNLVEMFGLQGVAVFVFIILLKPAYENLFPYADVVGVTVAVFLVCYYLDTYFSVLRESIGKENNANNKCLEKINEDVQDLNAKVNDIDTVLANRLPEIDKRFMDYTVDAKNEILKCVDKAKVGIDETFTKTAVNLLDDIEENTEALISDNADEREQVMQVLDYLTGNIDGQGNQLGKAVHILQNVNDKIGEEIRTETFEDKEGHTVLMNTVKNNLLQYSELRENNKLVFISFYKDGKIAASKTFNKDGKITGENKYYEDGELKERITYYTMNGETEAKVEKF